STSLFIISSLCRFSRVFATAVSLSSSELLIRWIGDNDVQLTRVSLVMRMDSIVMDKKQVLKQCGTLEARNLNTSRNSPNSDSNALTDLVDNAKLAFHAHKGPQGFRP